MLPAPCSFKSTILCAFSSAQGWCPIHDNGIQSNATTHRYCNSEIVRTKLTTTGLQIAVPVSSYLAILVLGNGFCCVENFFVKVAWIYIFCAFPGQKFESVYPASCKNSPPKDRQWQSSLLNASLPVCVLYSRLLQNGPART